MQLAAAESAWALQPLARALPSEASTRIAALKCLAQLVDTIGDGLLQTGSQVGTLLKAALTDSVLEIGAARAQLYLKFGEELDR